VQIFSKLSNSIKFIENFVENNGIMLLLRFLELPHIPTKLISCDILIIILSFPSYRQIVLSKYNLKEFFIAHIPNLSNIELKGYFLSILRLLMVENNCLKYDELIQTTHYKLFIDLAFSEFEFTVTDGKSEGVLDNTKFLENQYNCAIEQLEKHHLSRLSLLINTCGFIANLSEDKLFLLHPKIGNILHIFAEILNIYDSVDLNELISRTIMNILACTSLSKIEDVDIEKISSLLSILVKMNLNDDSREYVGISFIYLITDFMKHNQFKEDAIQSIYYMAGTDYTIYKKCAGKCLTSLWLSSTNYELLIQLDCIPHLISLALVEEPCIIEDAIFTLANISERMEFHYALFTKNIIPSLNFISERALHYSTKIQLSVSRILSTLSQTNYMKEVMGKTNLFSLLLQLSYSKEVECQRYAILAICNICSFRHSEYFIEPTTNYTFEVSSYSRDGHIGSTTNQKQFSSSFKGNQNEIESDFKHETQSFKNLLSGGNLSKTLIFLLQYPDIEVKKYAALAISGLYLGFNDSQLSIQENNKLVKELFEALKYPDNQLSEAVVTALNALCFGSNDKKNDDQYYEMLEENIPTFVNLLRSFHIKEDNLKQDESTLMNGLISVDTLNSFLIAIGSMYEDDKLRPKLIDLDTIQIVLNYQNIDNVLVKRSIGYILAVLSQYHVVHDEIFHQAGFQSLLKLAKSADTMTQESSVYALKNLADNVTYQVELVKIGAVKVLVSIADGVTDVKYYAMETLMKLASNFENHVKIAEEGGINALIKLSRRDMKYLNLQHEASLKTGYLATNAIKLLPHT
jgi:hypothetical protein